MLRLVSSGGGRGGPVPSSPCLALGRAPPRGLVYASGAVWRLGVLGGGGSFAAPPGGVVWSGSVGGSRGAGGGGSLSLSPSLCLPCTGTKAGFAGVAQFMEGVVPILLRFVFVRSRPGVVRGGRRGAVLCTGVWLAGRLAGWLTPRLATGTVGEGG